MEKLMFRSIPHTQFSSSSFQDQYKFCFKILWDYMNTRLECPAPQNSALFFRGALDNHYESYT